MKIDDDKVRAEFEKWATIYFENEFSKSPFLRDCNDVDADRTYQKYKIEDAYQAWNACQALNYTVIAAKDAEIARLRGAINITLEENGNLADGDNCTLIHLKQALEATND
jgi:hypothetical protein